MAGNVELSESRRVPAERGGDACRLAGRQAGSNHTNGRLGLVTARDATPRREEVCVIARLQGTQRHLTRPPVRGIPQPRAPVGFPQFHRPGRHRHRIGKLRAGLQIHRFEPVTANHPPALPNAHARGKSADRGVLEAGNFAAEERDERGGELATVCFEAGQTLRIERIITRRIQVDRDKRSPTPATGAENRAQSLLGQCTRLHSGSDPTHDPQPAFLVEDALRHVLQGKNEGRTLKPFRGRLFPSRSSQAHRQRVAAGIHHRPRGDRFPAAPAENLNRAKPGIDSDDFTVKTHRQKGSFRHKTVRHPGDVGGMLQQDVHPPHPRCRTLRSPLPGGLRQTPGKLRREPLVCQGRPRGPRELRQQEKPANRMHQGRGRRPPQGGAPFHQKRTRTGAGSINRCRQTGASAANHHNIKLAHEKEPAWHFWRQLSGQSSGKHGVRPLWRPAPWWMRAMVRGNSGVGPKSA